LVYNRRNYAQKKKAGQLNYKDESEVITVPGALPAIIDTETWEAVRRIRAERPRVDRPRSAKTQSSPYLLAGLARCTCGHLWIGRPAGRGQYFYGCAGAKSKGIAFSSRA
jgi:hypothetical protein